MQEEAPRTPEANGEAKEEATGSGHGEGMGAETKANAGAKGGATETRKEGDEEVVEIDEEAVMQYFAHGYRPHRHHTNKGIYITLRTQDGGQTSYGRYSDERWARLVEIYKAWKEANPPEPRRLPPPKDTGKGQGALLSARLTKPLPLKPTIPVDDEVILLYRWASEHGFVERCKEIGLEGSFGDFISQCVRGYFLQHGLSVAAVVKSE